MDDVKTGSATAESTRLDPRYPAATVSGITGMRLSPGDVVSLVNISASGVLVEGKTRFVPGTRLTVIFDGPSAPASVKGRVVRCQVSAIGGGGSRRISHQALRRQAVAGVHRSCDSCEHS